MRSARLEDAAALARLSSQLGYPVEPGLLVERLQGVLSRPDEVILIAGEEGGAPIAWIHGAEQRFLESGRRCEILGLVVDTAHRRAGVGQRLVAAVEQWAAGRGLAEISVRSNVARAESHPFYERLGFRRTKTQHVYRKLASSG